MRICVLQRDIDKSLEVKAANNLKNSLCCPIYQAACRQFGEDNVIHVGVDYIDMKDSMFYPVNRQKMLLFICNYDSKKRVNPIILNFKKKRSF